MENNSLVPTFTSKCSIFDIPHILLGITEYLSGKDLRSCSLVCHSWSLVLAPLTWTKLSTGNQDYSVLFSNPESTHPFKKRIHTIREISICPFHSNINSFVGLLRENPRLLANQLTSLTYTGVNFIYADYGKTTIPVNSATRNYSEHTTAPFDLFLYLMERNTETLLHTEIWIKHWPDSRSHLCTHLKNLKVLKSLVIKGFHEDPININYICSIFQSYPSSLKHLDISYAPTSNPDCIMPVEYILSPPPTLNTSWTLLWGNVKQSKLQTLVLPDQKGSRHYYQEFHDPVILNLLRYRCENLREFTFPSMKTSLSLVTESLSNCTSLRHLEFDDIPLDMIPVYVTAINGCKLLESITVSGKISDPQPIISAIITTHASRIKKVKWLGGGGLGGRLDLEELMRSCSRLEWIGTTIGRHYSFTEQGAVGGFRINDKPLPTAVDSDPTNASDLDLSLATLTLEESSHFSSSSNEQSFASNSTSSAIASTTTTTTTLPLTLPRPNPYWACASTLTYFDITFYPELEISDEELYRKQIEHMYIKLGQMEALETLYLGCRCRCFGRHLVYCVHSRYDYEYGDPEIVKAPEAVPNPEERAALYSPEVLAAGAKDGVILDMSLSTGLVHLSGLKNLRILNISKIMGHKVGYKELEWMKENWPRLREFYGTRNPLIKEWIRENWSSVSV